VRRVGWVFLGSDFFWGRKKKQRDSKKKLTASFLRSFLPSLLSQPPPGEDVVATAFDAATGELAAFATERLRRKWTTTAKAWDRDSELVHRVFNGSDEFSVASKASDNSRVILRFVSDTEPPTFYLLDRRNKNNRTLTKQITVRERDSFF